MTLVFDERSNLQGEPGLHAFITGVSSYRHLPEGSGEPADNDFGMRQLSSTALTAYNVYRWLLKWKNSLPVPLATIRLLLSPSEKEVEAEQELETLTEPCTRQNFAAEVKRWREDAASRDAFALFYFAGHGVQRKKDDAVILLEDFGNPNEGPLTNAVDTDNLFYGMAPPANQTKQIAHRQIYFIDACRLLPSQFYPNQWLNVPDLWPIELGGKDDRCAPVFFAAIPGTKAYALKGEQTLFSKALLECLNGAGAAALDEADDQGQARWGVTVHSLNEALMLQVDDLNLEYDGDQDYVMSGMVKNTVVHYLDGPPEVDVRLEIDPVDAIPFVELQVSDYRDTTVWDLHPIEPYPYENKLQAGFYRISAKIANSSPPPPYSDFMSWRQIKPPRTPLTCPLMKVNP